jgi:hypothetical protein
MLNHRIPTTEDIKIVGRIVSDSYNRLVELAGEFNKWPDIIQYRSLKKAMHDYEMALVDHTEVVNRLPKPRALTQRYHINEDLSPQAVEATIASLENS